MTNNDYESRMRAIFEKKPDSAIHDFLSEVYDYVDFVNQVSEILRLSEGIGSEPLDKDMTIGDVMLSIVRKGERLRSSAEILHEYANRMPDSEK